jgi:hypothetical protein
MPIGPSESRACCYWRCATRAPLATLNLGWDRGSSDGVYRLGRSLSRTNPYYAELGQDVVQSLIAELHAQISQERASSS